MAAHAPIIAPHWVAILISTLMALGSAYAYSARVESRLTAVETHIQDNDKHVEHIDSQVDRLVEWALGHK